MVPKGRFELPCPYGHYALNVARLPFRHFGIIRMNGLTRLSADRKIVALKREACKLGGALLAPVNFSCYNENRVSSLFRKGRGWGMKLPIWRGRLFWPAVAFALLMALASCSPPPAQEPGKPEPTSAYCPPFDLSPPQTITLTARHLAFDPSFIEIPAGIRLTIIFNNEDSVPHNFALYRTPAAEEPVFIGEVIPGPGTTIYEFITPDTASRLYFRCDIHPEVMPGTFMVLG